MITSLDCNLNAATLPAGYTELEYVEGTGTQYINTEYYPTPDTVATVDYQLTALSEPDHQTICGVNNGSGVATFKGYVRKTDNYFVLQIGDSDGWNSNNRVATLTRAKLVLDAQNKRAITTDAINGKGNSMSQSGITKTGTVPIGLFARIDTYASLAGAYAKMKLYSAIFAEKGVAKRNFVPCLNESGVAGVYDTVQPKFYPSLKDAFVAGPELATATVNDRSATASVTFPTAAVARELYLVGGQKDCAALATDWTYSVKIADIAANATTCTDVALPAAFAQGANKFYRLQIRSTAGKVEATTVSAIATWCDETGRRNVFADAAAVYVGAEDKNGNGLFDTGDWTDLRHAADPSSPTHQVSKYGSSPATNLVIRTVDVYSPTMDKTLKNQTCVFLKQGLEARTEDGKTIRRVYPASLNLNAPINGDTYTVLCRFRPGPKQTVRSTGDTWLFNLGCYWNNSGVFFGFHGLGGADYADAYRIIYSNGDNTYSADQTLVVSNAFWHEVAFVVKGAYARVELANGAISGRQQNSLFKTFENANAFPSTDAKCISSAPWGGNVVQCIGNGTTAEMTTTDDIHMTKDFRGDIHMVAIWNRALTHDEIVEAFANPQPSLWRVGEKGCSADLLTGSTTGDVTAGTDMQEWRKVPRTLTKGRKLTLNFTVEPNQANLPQAVRLVPAKAVTASVRFTLDGANLGSAALAGTAPVFAFATKRLLGAGAHTLVVERMDDGAGELAIDTLEMCGSWQIGNDDKLASSFGPYNATYADKEVISLAAQQHSGTTVVDYRSGSASWTPIKLHFFVPKEFVSDCKFAYETYHPYSSGTDDNLLTYKLNGQQIAQEALLGKPVSVKLPNEYLQAGENVLEVRLSKENDGNMHWLQFDYHRLVMKPNRGLFIVVQ